MKRCPITSEFIDDNRQYSVHGLRMLSPLLKNLAPLPLTAQQLRDEAMTRAGKMSIQGVQPKLSALLRVKNECFDIVDSKGDYILKMQSAIYPEVPENEALTMSMAATIGLEIPIHGLINAIDGSRVYFIKRFDRLPRNKKLAVEDFAQLLGLSRDTKYDSSMESVAKVIAQYCTFPVIEFAKLFRLTLFNFLIGNEDMHLKNFSLITRNDIITLSPAYDLLNSSIAIKKPEEEIALSLAGKKKNITRTNLVDYFAKERLGLNQKVIEEIIATVQRQIPIWHQMIEHSFLSPGMKESYLSLLQLRLRRLEL